MAEVKFKCPHCQADIQTAAVETSPVAIASLALGVLSFLCCCPPTAIAGIICGHVALVQIKSSEGTKSGREIAIAGLILSYISLIISVILLVLQFAFPLMLLPLLSKDLAGSGLS